jgi:putative peptidoglycan lipid II flippase
LPRTLSSSLNNITFIIIGAIASLLAAGSISIFQFSYNIENTPLLIIGVSYAVAAFPVMTRMYAAGEKKELLDVLYRTTRNIFFMCIPASLLMIVMRAQIVRLLLGAGVFSWNDTRLVAASVALFSLSIVAQCMELLMVRAFFAVGDTKTSLMINIWSTVVTIGSVVVLLFVYHDSTVFSAFLDNLLRINGTKGTSVVLLPLGFSIGETINTIALWFAFRKKIPATKIDRRALSRSLLHMIGAALIAATASYVMLSYIGTSVTGTHFIGVLIQAIIASTIGVVVYGIVLLAFRNEDMRLFVDTAKSRFWKQKPLVVQGQRDL